MATFSVDGLGDFMLSMQQVAELPGEVIDEILEAGSEVVIKAQKDELLTLGLYDIWWTASSSIKNSTQRPPVARTAMS